jgi:hypothetical protein
VLLESVVAEQWEQSVAFCPTCSLCAGALDRSELSHLLLAVAENPDDYQGPATGARKQSLQEVPGYLDPFLNNVYTQEAALQHAPPAGASAAGHKFVPSADQIASTLVPSERVYKWVTNFRSWHANRLRIDKMCAWPVHPVGGSLVPSTHPNSCKRHVPDAMCLRAVQVHRG